MGRLKYIWDIIALSLILGIGAAIAWGASRMAVPYQLGEVIEISLDPRMLPSYAVSTVLRMFIALFFSLLFTFLVAPLAAKNQQAEKFLIPFIDIMQSIPVLGMLAITVVGFIHLFPNSMLGPECAAIFAIFVSQVWNMALSLYQSLRTVPKDLLEAAKVYRLSKWQQFWRIEVPHATPGLLWNTMVSMSAGWFFVVLSEAISVANQNITLPGVGSYISKAVLAADLHAMGYAIVTMLIVILLYDQFLFRPLLVWAEKFHADIDEEIVYQQSWFFDLLAQTRLLKKVGGYFDIVLDYLINGWAKPSSASDNQHNWFAAYYPLIAKTTRILWNLILFISLISALFSISRFIAHAITPSEIGYVLYLGLITAAKVVVLIILASIIWIPIGVWIGLQPRISNFVQPLIQFVAAFPANFLYPVAAFFILRYQLKQDIWATPLMILGTQWYILFNVIAGASTIPKELKFAAKNFGIKGRLWWQKLALPAIFPFYVTGAMTAAGGCWNASIVAEYIEYGSNTIASVGLGNYITEYTRQGDFPRIALGIAVMCLYVMLFNRLVWNKLYKFAATRFTLE